MFIAGSPSASADVKSEDARAGLAAEFAKVRGRSLALTSTLSPEDHMLQSMPDVSPVKWHLAHVTWFFERFVLMPFAAKYDEFHSAFDHLFNSYYHTVGTMHARAQRGLLSRPALDEVHAYRHYVEAAVARLIADCPDAQWRELSERIILGLNHEEQHQELILTDIKHALWHNPMRPAVFAPAEQQAPWLAQDANAWVQYEGGLCNIGHGGAGFAFDNETPRHKIWLEPFSLQTKPIRNRDYLSFMQSCGYADVALWLSDGWSTVQKQGWQAPLYWEQKDDAWFAYTLAGLVPLELEAPVCHLSYYEADAFARWAGARLPTEAELELALADEPLQGNLLAEPDERATLAAPAPKPATQKGNRLHQAYGDVWEWTQSPYTAYPGFMPLAGSLGEYNGKFMSNQMVLRGGSCSTPQNHIRASYRNFFYAPDRWQHTGLRLAKSA